MEVLIAASVTGKKDAVIGGEETDCKGTVGSGPREWLWLSDAASLFPCRYCQGLDIEDTRRVAAEKDTALIGTERSSQNGSRVHELFDGVTLHMSGQ